MAIKMIHFKVPIPPKAQGRGRVGAMRIGTNEDGSAKYRGMIFEDKKSKTHKQSFRAVAELHRPMERFEGPIEVRIVAVFPRPKYLSKVSKRTGEPLAAAGRRWHTTKPDKDNVEKAVLDALKDWWSDDCEVCVGATFKQIAAFGEEPHYEVMVSEIVNASQNGNVPPVKLSDISEYWYMGYPF